MHLKLPNHKPMKKKNKPKKNKKRKEKNSDVIPSCEAKGINKHLTKQKRRRSGMA